MDGFTCVRFINDELSFEEEFALAKEASAYEYEREEGNTYEV